MVNDENNNTFITLNQYPTSIYLEIADFLFARHILYTVSMQGDLEHASGHNRVVGHPWLCYTHHSAEIFLWTNYMEKCFFYEIKISLSFFMYTLTSTI